MISKLTSRLTDGQKVFLGTATMIGISYLAMIMGRRGREILIEDEKINPGKTSVALQKKQELKAQEQERIQKLREQFQRERAENQKAN
mmetsp:Transcript_10446/g.17931  ORF Transcript_10446/g.17931 Transcript_10446/m.17931 type:complete len:88 (+) Transcript_10446:116-379(+)